MNVIKKRGNTYISIKKHRWHYHHHRRRHQHQMWGAKTDKTTNTTDTFPSSLSSEHFISIGIVTVITQKTAGAIGFRRCPLMLFLYSFGNLKLFILVVWVFCTRETIILQIGCNDSQPLCCTLYFCTQYRSKNATMNAYV